MDGRADKDKDLIFYQDEKVVAFVPKAQRSQGEVQLMTKVKCGNIVETDTETRNSLDRAMLLTMKVLENLGVEMFTALEISKRLENPDSDQRLLYCFLPRHPRSPGGFSEFQQRWISNHYPEDFAKVCRDEVYKIMENDT
jgi:diadenosine tetraphosphate (Ap4A) HIT family hydrolase